MVLSRKGLKLENHNYPKLQFGQSKQLAIFFIAGGGGGVLLLQKRNMGRLEF